MNNRDGRARIVELETVLGLILKEPYGCPMCDSGKLRNPEKEHWDACGFAAARRVLQRRTYACGCSAEGATPVPDQCPEHAGADIVCEHGTAMDVHCCGCHSGFLFDLESCTCLEGSAEAAQPPEKHRCSGCGHRWEGTRGTELCGDCWRKRQARILGSAEATKQEQELK